MLEFHPQRENAEKIKVVYDLYYSDNDRLREELKNLGLSRNRILQLFQNQYEKTPTEYLNGLRIDNAKKLLANTPDNILQIALQSGFGSLSSFYTQFKRVTGVSPNEYRENLTGKNAD